MKDCNPYTPEQLQFLQKVEPMVAGWHEPVEAEGLVVKKGAGWELWIDGFNWMNMNPVDLLDHQCIFDFHGRCCFTGFGLGLAVIYACHNPKITSVDVVENDERVVRHVWPMIEKRLPKGLRVTLIDADADDFSPTGYDCAYLDHGRTAVPAATAERFSAACGVVRTWPDEFRRVTNWQV